MSDVGVRRIALSLDNDYAILLEIAVCEQCSMRSFARCALLAALIRSLAALIRSLAALIRSLVALIHFPAVVIHVVAALIRSFAALTRPIIGKRSLYELNVSIL